MTIALGVLGYLAIGYGVFAFWCWRCPPRKEFGEVRMLGWDYNWELSGRWHIESAAKVSVLVWPVVVAMWLLKRVGDVIGVMGHFLATGLTRPRLKHIPPATPPKSPELIAGEKEVEELLS